MPGKTIFLALIILSLKTSLFAQTTLGVEGGLSYNSYHTNISNRAATDLSGHAGYNLSLSLRYKILPWLYAIAAPGLVQKGYSMNRTDSLSGEYDEHINTYLQLPVGVGAVYERQRWTSVSTPATGCMDTSKAKQPTYSEPPGPQESITPSSPTTRPTLLANNATTAGRKAGGSDQQYNTVLPNPGGSPPEQNSTSPSPARERPPSAPFLRTTAPGYSPSAAHGR
jgi:hypothetical protein